MPIDFPNSPTVGQTYTANGRTWTWNGTAWRGQGTNFGPTGPIGPAGTFSVSATAPSNPFEGLMWYNSTNSRMYIYYDAVWVEISSSLVGPTGPNGPIGATGPTGPTGPDGTFSSAQPIQNLTAAITIVAADAGSLKTNTGAAGTISVGFSTLTPLTVGQQVDFLQTSAFAFVFSGTGVTLFSKSGNLRTSGLYTAASIKCIATNTYVLVGDLSA